ncbi:cysteine hydrolase family protein [Pseudomonas gingeri]|uniref:Cysteine hydrolase n=1 Tax=Pseudomonas gingeri TaxID=117681 RepID=A0A7Y8CKN2_9PSED|nr:cysteine hydrolase family protein [Pseudomonas gingeri]NWB27609.1 cysteine hydrolase [Pseudomonas gingeri]NWC34221.1 cysteine hydrolase [Pseudomonas gingeri]NWD06017.1 cysteine hydrolase [Pseudomonas gingeri]NWD51574.1 cysteine hydrolase [Pseudomonas gingeri]NWE32629.1 cysteine hydrolase [Pseudomonas gingeri]
MATIGDRTALIVIDQQQGIQQPRLGPRNNPQAEERMAELLRHWRGNARPVIHVQHLSRSPESVFWPGQSGVEFQQRFRPSAGEWLVQKDVPDAFCATGLQVRLQEAGIEQLVIVGVATNNSVESTARTAGNLGFATWVVEDACYTFDKVDFFGQPRSAQEVHAMSLGNLHGEYATVVSSRELL